MRKGISKIVMIIAVCAVSLTISAGAFAQDADADLASGLYQAAVDARTAGDYAQSVQLVQALAAQCPGAGETVKGLLMMAEMAILGEINDTYRAQAYQGLLLVRETNLLEIRLNSLGWFASLDAANNWQLSWQLLQDRAGVEPKRGKAFVTIVKTAQDIQGAQVMWTLLDRAHLDLQVSPLWRKNVDAILATIENEQGPAQALTTAKQIALRYPTHCMGAAGLFYGWEVTGRTGGVAAQMAYLKEFKDNCEACDVRTKATCRLSDHYIYQNDIAGAVSAQMPAVEASEVFAQSVEDIEAGAAALATYLQSEDGAKVTWDGARTADSVLAKLAAAAADAGLADVSADITAAAAE